MICQEQVIKFTNYLLTRKHVQSVRETATLLLAVNKLGNNLVSDNDLHVNKSQASILHGNFMRPSLAHHGAIIGPLSIVGPITSPSGMGVISSQYVHTCRYCSDNG